MKVPNKNSCLTLFQSNTCSSNKHFADLEYLVKSANVKVELIAISETKILKDSDIVKNINIQNFSFEFTPTKLTVPFTLK